MHTLNGDTPYYQQLVTIFKSQYAAGILKIGDLLPTEMLLCETYRVSRSTVRKALQILERDGYVIRKRGKGTIVCAQKLKRNLDNLYNFSSEMRLLGLVPSSSVLSFRKSKTTPAISEALGISEDELVYTIKRLRMADGEPLLLERAYIPVRFCENLRIEDLNDSLYGKIFEHNGVSLTEATETYEAIRLTEKDSNALKCSPSSAALRICRTSRNAIGEIVEYCIILARGDKNIYQITLRRNDIECSRSII